MAATADIATKRVLGDEHEPYMGAVQIFAGTLVCIDTGTGYAEPATDATSKRFAGVAKEWKDNSDGSAGDERIKLWRKFSFCFKADFTPSIDDCGKKLYVVDDETVGLAADATNDVCVGEMVAIDDEDASYVWVDIERMEPIS